MATYKRFAVLAGLKLAKPPAAQQSCPTYASEARCSLSCRVSGRAAKGFGGKAVNSGCARRPKLPKTFYFHSGLVSAANTWNPTDPNKSLLKPERRQHGQRVLRGLRLACALEFASLLPANGGLSGIFRAGKRCCMQSLTTSMCCVAVIQQ